MDTIKLAVVDLDGVVADSTERFQRATCENGSIDWQVAFDPALVSLDTLIPGTLEAIDFLESKGYEVVFLTSRPESMREATEEWLGLHDHDGYEVMMKPEEKKYVKTVTWKAEEVARLASIPGVQEVLFIDDEKKNCEAVRALGLGTVICASSLEPYTLQEKPFII
jgi:phosphoglycolate phosphatase-like HAD superfamily hydrolase